MSDDLIDKINDIETTVEEETGFGYAAWLLMTHLLKRLVADNRMTADELRSITSAALLTAEENPRVPIERMRHIIEFTESQALGEEFLGDDDDSADS